MGSGRRVNVWRRRCENVRNERNIHDKRIDIHGVVDRSLQCNIVRLGYDGVLDVLHWHSNLER